MSRRTRSLSSRKRKNRPPNNKIRYYRQRMKELKNSSSSSYRNPQSSVSIYESILEEKPYPRYNVSMKNQMQNNDINKQFYLKHQYRNYKKAPFKIPYRNGGGGKRKRNKKSKKSVVSNKKTKMSKEDMYYNYYKKDDDEEEGSSSLNIDENLRNMLQMTLNKMDHTKKNSSFDYKRRLNQDLASKDYNFRKTKLDKAKMKEKRKMNMSLILKNKKLSNSFLHEEGEGGIVSYDYISQQEKERDRRIRNLTEENWNLKEEIEKRNSQIEKLSMNLSLLKDHVTLLQNRIDKIDEEKLKMEDFVSKEIRNSPLVMGMNQKRKNVSLGMKNFEVYDDYDEYEVGMDRNVGISQIDNDIIVSVGNSNQRTLEEYINHLEFEEEEKIL